MKGMTELLGSITGHVISEPGTGRKLLVHDPDFLTGLWNVWRLVCLYALIATLHIGSVSPLGASIDYTNILPVEVELQSNPVTRIELCTRNDAVTLEYDDTVLLVFSPDESDLIQIYEDEGEYIRDIVTVHIIDNDRK